MTTILQQRTIAPGTADWSGTVTFDQFDPASGNLLGAAFETSGTIDVAASIENLAPVAAHVNLDIAASIVATVPGIGVVGAVTPVAGPPASGTIITITAGDIGGMPVDLPAFQGSFDGTLDFGGPSGTVLPDLTGSATQVAIVGPGTVAAPLVGTGTFDVGVSSHATATVTGNANLAVLLHSSAGAGVSLQYDATPSNGGGPGGDLGSGITSFIPIVGVGGWSYLSISAPQTVTLASQTSGWSGTAAFDQFDPSHGTLLAIFLNLGAAVAGSFAAENLEAVPGAVSMAETGSLTVATPGSPFSMTGTVGTTGTFALGGFDGSADFAGASGQMQTFANRMDDSFDDDPSNQLFDTADLNAFTGTGTIALPVSTAGTSTVTGPADMLFELTQHLGGTVSIRYVYTTDVAENWAASHDYDPRDMWSDPPGIPGDARHFPTEANATPWAANAPRMTFIDGSNALSGPASVLAAQPGETFAIAAGATATIDDFSPSAGDRLDLSGLLAGAQIASDRSNIGTFISATPSGDGTLLSVHGPQGGATLMLAGGTPVALADLLNDNALVLPAH